MPKIKYIPGEEIIFEIRPSFFILAGQLLPLIVAVAGILAIFYFSGLYNFWLYLAVLVAGIIAALAVFLNWYFTIFRLTNKRVENRIGIFGSREEEIAIEDVQNVDVVTTFWGSIFSYGTVLVKAAGASREVDFTNIASPKKIANKIEDMVLGGKGKNNG